MSGESQFIGPYRLLGLLGRGAMGAVYRAEHAQDGQLVALKTVKTPWAALLPRIRSEIHALGRLRHPGVVQILDSGAQDGVPWYAMELIQGPTLREHACKLELSRPGELLELLSVVRRLCAALAYVHGEGIVHRDLKPDNILIRQEPGARNDLVGAGLALPFEGEAILAPTIAKGEASLAPTFAGSRPVLVDFGVLTEWPAAMGRENLAADGAGAGTPLYMAPEQLRGEMVDARADLYSLGCLLYELLAGRPPFEGKVWEVCEAHLHAEARPLSELAPWVPAALDELVRLLMAKEPRRRMGYATDVAVALAALGADAGAQESAPEPQAYLYRPGFVGRSRTLEALDGHLARLMAGAGDLLLIGGESGVGKTRLLKELERRARAQGIRVLTGECLPPAGLSHERAGGGPLQALSRPLRALGDWCRQQGASETERLLGRRGRLLARYEPTLLDLPGIQQAAEPPDLPAEPARLRLFEALVASFTAFAHRNPLLVALDDLHWADELTAGWLEFLVRRAEAGAASRAPLLLVGAYRSEEAGEVLERLSHAIGTTHMSLERLEAEPLGAMAGQMLAMETLSELFVRFLARRSAGNPFFVGEYLRTAVAEGVLYRDEKGCWQVADESQAPATEAVFEALPLPGSVRALVARRLGALGAEARRVIDMAAVFGREVEAVVLGRALRMGEERRLEALRGLLLRQVLEEPEPGRLRFAHDQIREAAYASLSRARRKKLHGAAAAALEAHHGPQSAEHQAALGQHWEQAGVQARARDCLLAAARYAVGRYAHAEAERQYRAYLALVERPDAESVTARNELARQVLYFQGRTEEGIEELGRAVREAQSLAHLPLRAASLYQLSVLYQKTGRIDEGRGLCLEALALEHQLGNRPGEGRDLNLLGIFEAEQGRPEAALAAYEAALAIDRECGDRSGQVLSLGNLANMYCDQGRLPESSAFHEQALAILGELRDPWLEGLVLGNLANVYAAQGRLAEARALHERALAIHRELARRASEGIVLCNLGFVCRMQGDLETAELHFKQGLAIDREVGNRRGEGIHVTQFAAMLHDGGRAEQAFEALQRGLEIAREIHDPRTEAYALYEEGRLRRRVAAEPALAADRIRKAEAILEEFEDRLGIAQCVIERGHRSLALGESGRGLLQRAQGLVASFGVGPDSEVGQALARLERAVEAFELGRPLFRGECPEDLPAGLQRWLQDPGGLRPFSP